MKNIFKIITLTTVILFASCNEDDTILFDPDNLDDTLLNVATESSETMANLGILINETASIDIMVQSSTLLNTDRTFTISIVDDLTDADPIYFNLPSSVTIPANEFTGVFTIDGQDPVGEILAQTLVINVTDGEFSENFTINISIVGPFAGDYQLTVLEGVFPAFGANLTFADGPVFINPVSDEDGLLVRSINLAYLPEFNGGSGFPFDFTFSIQDDTVIVPNQTSGGGVVCGAGTPAIELESSPDDQATVNLDDDETYQIIFNDAVGDDACGVDPYRIVMELTRI